MFVLIFLNFNQNSISMKEKRILMVSKQTLIENFSRWFLNRIGKHKFDSEYQFNISCSCNYTVYIDVVIPFGFINYFGTHTEKKFLFGKSRYCFMKSLVDFKKECIVMTFLKERCLIINSPVVSNNDVVEDLPF